MKVKHVLAALALACGVAHLALAQEETAPQAEAPAAASAAQESKEAGHDKARSQTHSNSHSRAARRARKHAAQTASEASGTSGNAAEEPARTEAAPAEKVAAAPAAASAPASAPQQGLEASAGMQATQPEKVVAPAAPAAAAVPEKPATDRAAPAPAEAPKSWSDNFIYGIKATDILLALFAGLLVLIARAQARRLRETAEASAATAHAAQQTARSAENALVAGQRAFMFLREFKTFLNYDEAAGRYRWTIHPVWENNGNTPTKGLSIYTTYRLLDEPLPADYAFPSSEEERVATIAAPKALVEAAPGGIDADELAAVRQGKKYFYIWGRAEYHDIFEGTVRHTTRFCNQLMQVIGDPGAPVSERNMVQMMFGFHSENNSAD